jgi:hypothetical protein
MSDLRRKNRCRPVLENFEDRCLLTAGATQTVHALFSVSLPKVKLPNISIPKPKLPVISIPKPKLPVISIPKPKLPVISIPKPKLPVIKVPKVKLPKINVPKIGDPSVELWGTGGRLAFPASAAIMATRNTNRPPTVISLSDKAVLRPKLGSIVDKVTLYYGADPLNAWGTGTYTVKLGGAEAAAQTFGYNIYIRSSQEGLSDRDRLSTLIHELTHAQQYERFGASLSNFGYEYFKEYKKGGLSYESNKLEKEAYAQESALIDSVYSAFVAAKGGSTDGSTNKIEPVSYTLQNDSQVTVQVTMSPSGKSYTFAPGYKGNFSSNKVNGKPPTMLVLNTGRTYTLTEGSHHFFFMTSENRVGFN